MRTDVGEWFIARLTGSAPGGGDAELIIGGECIVGGEFVKVGDTLAVGDAGAPGCGTIRMLLWGFDTELSVDPNREALPCPADSMLRRGGPSLDGGDGTRSMEDVGLCVKGPLFSTPGSLGDCGCPGGDVVRGCSGIGAGTDPPCPSVDLRCGLSTVVESIDCVLRCVMTLLRSDIGVSPWELEAGAWFSEPKLSGGSCGLARASVRGGLCGGGLPKSPIGGRLGGPSTVRCWIGCCCCCWGAPGARPGIRSRRMFNSLDLIAEVRSSLTSSVSACSRSRKRSCKALSITTMNERKGTHVAVRPNGVGKHE